MPTASPSDRYPRQGRSEKALVFMEPAGGYSDDCCRSFATRTSADGRARRRREHAKDIIPGTFGTVNPEAGHRVQSRQIIITGGNWEGYVSWGAWVGVGYGGDEKEAQRQADALTTRPAFTG